MNFKIIGLRILEGCYPRFKKNLDENIFYNFLNEYSFNLDINNEIESIEFKQTVPDNFYSFNTNNLNGQINISAIVGNNGSGKSNLLELLMASMLIISCKLRSDLLDLNKFAAENKVDIEKLKADFEDLEKINIEIIYKSTLEGAPKEFISKITFNKKKLLKTDYFKSDPDNNIFNIQEENEIYQDHESSDILYDLFYNNYINYSLHSLNSKDFGVWLETIFHKNDGYKLPIVINPYRTNGIIDINKENYLNLNRFLVNVIQYDSLRIVNGKKITSIIITLNEHKLDNARNKITHISQALKNDIIEMLTKNSPSFDLNKEDKLYLNTVDYIIYKLVNISNNIDYLEYNNILDINVSENIKTEKFQEFLQKIEIDQTHVTLKLKQAINYIVVKQVDETDLNTNIIDLNDRIKNKLNNKLGLDLDFYPIIFFLPSFFNFEINFENSFNFNKLSSGEKHKLYVIHSIIYHIRNIISRHENYKTNNIPYRNINIILDEVELYMHPEYQRTLIFDLIRHINLLNLQETNINIMFATHSPFILSDIPSQNVLKLDDGSPIFDNKVINSFAANIYDLLADEFFLKNGAIGEYASNKIKNILNKDIINQEDIDIINLIGDPFLKGMIKKKIENRLSDELLTKEIERLQKIKDKRSSDAKN